jgi:hypothetical protein
MVPVAVERCINPLKQRLGLLMISKTLAYVEMALGVYRDFYRKPSSPVGVALLWISAKHQHLTTLDGSFPLDARQDMRARDFQDSRASQRYLAT